MMTLEGHVFWADDTPLVDSRFLSPEKVAGHRQVTDAHLLAVALRHEGFLATLDGGTRSVLPPGFASEAVHLLGEP